MTDIATRIRAELDVHRSRSDWFALSTALGAVLDYCDLMHRESTMLRPDVLAIRLRIAKALGISDSPAAAGSQPSTAPDSSDGSGMRETLPPEAQPAVLLTEEDRREIEDDARRDRAADALSYHEEGDRP